MSVKKLMMATAATAAVFAGTAAHAVDGCAVLLCLVKGGSGYKECKDILSEFYKDTALGKPPPRCKMGSSPGVPDQVSSQEGYATATTGANNTTINPYGDKVSESQYTGATSSATTAAADAQVQANAGVRTVDATSVLSSDNGATATNSADSAASSASDTLASSTCTTSCEVTPDATLVDDSIKDEVTAQLIAEGSLPATTTTTTTP